MQASLQHEFMEVKMAQQAVSASKRAISFGPFRVLPTQRSLLEAEKPVRLGSRALDLLIALVEHLGEVVGRTC